MIRAVTFDAGGTLIHWFTHPSRQFGELCRLAGIGLSAEDARRASEACVRFRSSNPPRPDRPVEDAWWLEHDEVGLRAAGLSEDLPVLAQRIQAVAHNLRVGWVLDPDIPAVLEELAARGLVLGVVSNWDGTLRRRLEALGVARYFRYIADSGELGVSKPDPEILRVACRRLGVALADCLHVGDRPDTDGGVAAAAGASALIYDPLGALEVDLPRVTRLRDVVTRLEA